MFWNQLRKMQRIQNYFILGTQLLGLAFSERFELIWVCWGFVGMERDGLVGLFWVSATFAKKRNCISGSGTARLMAPIIMSDGLPQASSCLYGKFCDRTSSDVSHHSIDGISEGVDGTSQRLCAQIKTKAYPESVNGNCCTQYPICPNSRGNLQNVNLLTDAKKYSTSLTVMKNCTAFPQMGIGGIDFEMQLFPHSSGGVFCTGEIWHSEKKQVEFLQNLQIRRLKNSVRAQGSSLSRARERHKSFIHG